MPSQVPAGTGADLGFDFGGGLKFGKSAIILQTIWTAKKTPSELSLADLGGFKTLPG